MTTASTRNHASTCWRSMAHHPSWVGHLTGGSQSTPTVHPCLVRQGDCGWFTHPPRALHRQVVSPRPKFSPKLIVQFRSRWYTDSGTEARTQHLEEQPEATVFQKSWAEILYSRPSFSSPDSLLVLNQLSVQHHVPGRRKWCRQGERLHVWMRRRLRVDVLENGPVCVAKECEIFSRTRFNGADESEAEESKHQNKQQAPLPFHAFTAHRSHTCLHATLTSAFYTYIYIYMYILMNSFTLLFTSSLQFLILGGTSREGLGEWVYWLLQLVSMCAQQYVEWPEACGKSWVRRPITCGCCGLNHEESSDSNWCVRSGWWVSLVCEHSLFIILVWQVKSQSLYCVVQDWFALLFFSHSSTREIAAGLIAVAAAIRDTEWDQIKTPCRHTCLHRTLAVRTQSRSCTSTVKLARVPKSQSIHIYFYIYVYTQIYITIYYDTWHLRRNDRAWQQDQVMRLSQEPKRSGTNREPQEVPQEIPQEYSEKHPDNVFKVITFTRSKSHDTELMEQGTKKFVLGDCEVTDAGCHVIADIVKVNDTIEELVLPKNTISSKKHKISLDESAATVEKVKTTTLWCITRTHLHEVHEECVAQSPYW